MRARPGALARDLVERTGFGMEQVVERAGFGSARHMRRVWRQFHPMPPSELREASFGHPVLRANS